jgi:hypothetical protein
MLFESPFYVDYPVTIGAGFGAFALAALWMLVVFNRGASFHDFVVSYFHARYPGVPVDKWPKAVPFLFVFFVVVFGTLALYCVSVATGIVKNKDNSISPEQMELLRRIHEKHRPEQKSGSDD